MHANLTSPTTPKEPYPNTSEFCTAEEMTVMNSPMILWENFVRSIFQKEVEKAQSTGCCMVNWELTFFRF